MLYFTDEQSLYNPRLKRRYEVSDDIPNLLVDEAETVSDDSSTKRLKPSGERTGSKPAFGA